MAVAKMQDMLIPSPVQSPTMQASDCCALHPQAIMSIELVEEGPGFFLALSKATEATDALSEEVLPAVDARQLHLEMSIPPVMDTPPPMLK